MKKYIKMKAFKALFLILVINSFLLGRGGCLYDEIIDFLQKNGIYEIIEYIKIFLGLDPAISFCEDFDIPETICNYIIRIIMGDHLPSSPPSPKNDIEDVLSKIHATKKFKEIIRKLYKEANNESRSLIYIISSNYDILIQKKKEDEIIALIKKMIYKINL